MKSWLFKALKLAGLMNADGHRITNLGEPDGPADAARKQDAVVTQDITSALTVGSIQAGDTIATDTNLTELLEQLLLATFNPTFVLPSLSIDPNISSNVEAGTIDDILVEAFFDQGSILGDGSPWDPNAVQNPRSGPATAVRIGGPSIPAVDVFPSTDRTFNAFQIEDGANQFTAEVDYDEGPQPLDSDGNPFDNPYPAGDVSVTTTVNGRRRLFFEANTANTNPYDTSSDVRAAANSSLNPSNGTQFTINIPAGTQQVMFAYRSTLNPVSSVLYVEGFNADVKGVFTETTVSVAGANGYTPINYRVYTFVPVEPFADSATYIVTI